MKFYNNCFVGIPLSDVLNNMLEELLGEIKGIDKSVKVTKPQNPHITIYFLNQQPATSISEIVKVVKPQLHILQDTTLEIGGYGHFKRPDSNIVFIGVRKSGPLLKFYNAISKGLAKYYSKKGRFIPHLTLAKVEDKPSSELIKLINDVDWKILVKDVLVYGRDPDKRNVQKSLATMKVRHK